MADSSHLCSVRRSASRLLTSVACLTAVLGLAADGHADLGRDVERLVLAYTAFGQIGRLAPRLLERGDVLPLVLAAEPLDPEKPGCLTVAVLGTTGTHFLLDPGVAPKAEPDEDAWPEGSLAGALELTRCGADKPELSGLLLEMRSPRGVLEFVTLASSAPPPRLAQVLPHRNPGPAAPLRGSGPRPNVAPLPLRLRAVEERAAREQAIELSVQEVAASATGNGSVLVTLGVGCHRFELLGDEAGQRAQDVDLELTRADDGELLAADHGESTDAGALVCVAKPMPVTVRFAGVAPLARLALARARWDLEQNLPARWPAEVRARVSAVLRERGVSLARAMLVDESLGVQGDTLASIEVEPGGCYVAVAVQLRGRDAVLSLAARTARSTVQSRLDPAVPGALATFCTSHDTRIPVEVSARGLGVVWMAAVFRTGGLRLGERAQ